MVINYFKIGWRSIVRSKAYSLINIVGLSIGLTTTLLIGLWSWDELTFNSVHSNHDEIAGVWVTTTHDGDMQTGPAIPIPLAAELRNNYAGQFKKLVLASWNWNHTLSVTSDKTILREGMYTEPDFPQMFSMELVEGNLSSALVEPNSIILSSSTALALFGHESAIGKNVRLDNSYDVTVEGIYKDFPSSSAFTRGRQKQRNHQVLLYVFASLYWHLST